MSKEAKQKVGFVSSYMYLELKEKLKTMMTQNVGIVLRDVYNKLNKTWRRMFIFSEEETVNILSPGNFSDKVGDWRVSSKPNHLPTPSMTCTKSTSCSSHV
jgi:hypothetical protein